MNLKSLIFLTAAISAGSALANEATLVNQSSRPLTIKYLLAYQKDQGQPVQFIGPIEAKIQENTPPIRFDLDNNKYAGIVPISFSIDNGQTWHKLPSSVNRFNTPQSCSLTTNGNKTNGSLIFTAGSHHLSCSVQGGIF